MDVSCHRPFLPGTSLEPAVILTAQASSFTLQYFPSLLSAPSDSFVQFLSIFLPDSDVRWTLRWSMLRFLGMITILFSAVRGPLLFPSSWLCIIIGVSRVARDVFCPLRYSPACRSKAA